jgi:hypothetical protein
LQRRNTAACLFFYRASIGAGGFLAPLIRARLRSLGEKIGGLLYTLMRISLKTERPKRRPADGGAGDNGSAAFAASNASAQSQ